MGDGDVEEDSGIAKDVSDEGRWLEGYRTIGHACIGETHRGRAFLLVFVVGHRLLVVGRLASVPTFLSNLSIIFLLLLCYLSLLSWILSWVLRYVSLLLVGSSLTVPRKHMSNTPPRSANGIES